MATSLLYWQVDIIDINGDLTHPQSGLGGQAMVFIQRQVIERDGGRLLSKATTAAMEVRPKAGDLQRLEWNVGDPLIPQSSRLTLDIRSTGVLRQASLLSQADLLSQAGLFSQASLFGQAGFVTLAIARVGCPTSSPLHIFPGCHGLPLTG
ncbi:hypothetical protein NM74_07895 [Aeromonas hydrophila]|nr:hypothetical protein NM74_07895 [Aeromonas hydrophila]